MGLWSIRAPRSHGSQQTPWRCSMPHSQLLCKQQAARRQARHPAASASTRPLLPPACFPLSDMQRAADAPDVCRDGHNTLESWAGVLPNMTLVFSTASLPLLPKAYLYLNRPATATTAAIWCSAIYDNGRRGALLGAITMRDVVVTYDNRVGSEELRFRPVPSCAAFSTAASTATNTHAAPGRAERSGSSVDAEELPASAADAPIAPDASAAPGHQRPDSADAGDTPESDSGDSERVGTAPGRGSGAEQGSPTSQGLQENTEQDGHLLPSTAAFGSVVRCLPPRFVEAAQLFA